MSTAAVMVSELDQENTAPAARKGAGVLGLWGSSLIFLFMPRRMSQLWARSTVWEAGVIAVINIFFGALWGYLVALCVYVWGMRTSFYTAADGWDWHVFDEISQRFPHDMAREWGQLALLDKVSSAGMAVMILGVVVLLPFFVLLPFAARPGRNSACVRHVARAVLLITGAVNLWGAVLVATAVWLVIRNSSTPMATVLWVTTALAVWLFAAAVRAVRVDYRGEVDMPEPHDPWCDDCGYDLVMSDPAGRCPECGRPVADSIGADKRPSTAWEEKPSVWNVGVIVRQLRLLVVAPRTLFFSMPTLTGQAAAQRWMLLSMGVIACLSALIVPGMMLVIQHGRISEWSPEAVAGTATMALVWPVFAMMMVGIETAGIATFSKMRGRPVYLSAAAKVTCHSSILMFLWVILGGAQLIGMIGWYLYYFSMGHAGTIRTQQIFLAVSLSAAHIGGLLWYELTVYRGIRAIQFANK